MKASKNIVVAAWTLVQFGIFSVGLGLIVSLWFATKISYGKFPGGDYAPLYASVTAAIGCGILAALLFKRNIVGYWLTIIFAVLFAFFQLWRLLYVLYTTLYLGEGTVGDDVPLVVFQTVVTLCATVLITRMLLPKYVRLEFKKRK